MSRSLVLDALFATVLAFALCGFFGCVFSLNLGFMDPVHSALHHVGEEFDNHVHASTTAPATAFSPNVCLVDIGSADRAGIAQLLTTIARQQPRVVAVDVVFDKKNEPADARLQRVLARLAGQRKLVMASWLDVAGDKHEHTTTVYQSDPPFRLGAAGYTNFVVSGSDDVVRHVLPRQENPAAVSFAAQTVAIAKPDIWQQYARNLEPDRPVRIVYQPNPTPFRRFSQTQLSDTTVRLPALRDAVVLVGSMAGLDDRYVSEDVHTVPIGEGQRMAGLEIHANIVAMLLQGSYLTHVPDGVMWALSFPLCYLLMLFFINQFQQHHLTFHIVFKGVQFLTAAALVLLALLLFRYARTELNVLPLLVPVALSVDVLYFYETLARRLSAWMHKQAAGGNKFAQWLNYETYFTPHAHAH